jgi:hypothetical protein
MAVICSVKLETTEPEISKLEHENILLSLIEIRNE